MPRYDALCAVLPEYFQPYSGLRTAFDQERIYAIGRTSAIGSPIRTNARAWESPHNYGCASDWTIFDARGRAKWPSLDDAVWQEYDDACDSADLRWGGPWGDGPHNELPIDLRWSSVARQLKIDGMLGDEAYIRTFLEKHTV